MKNELTSTYGNGAYARQFLSAGPKSYSLEIVVPGKPETEWKLCFKGFSFTCQTLEKLNAKVILDMVLHDPYKTVEIEESHRIVRNKKLARLSSVTKCKTFKLVYTKHVLMRDYCTLPYGFYAE